jgi:non-heme Fe2+,alpha-ketoglutarate-dependent halogenase
MPKKLTQQQILAYERDGFVAPVDVMPCAQTLALRQHLEAIEQRFPERFRAQNRNNAHYEFLFMDEIVHDSRILNAIEDLVGADLLLWSTVLFINDAKTPAHVSFHQDATYMGIEPQAGVTAWLALTPATTENGCMLMEKGSHKGEIHEHEDTYSDANILTRGQTIRKVNDQAVEPIKLKPGQMSLHHVRTVHTSAANQSNDRRIGVVLQAFFTPSSRQIKGDNYALLVRGQDRFGHSYPGRRPLANNEAADVNFRTKANERFVEIPYSDARTKRAL